MNDFLGITPTGVEPRLSSSNPLERLIDSVTTTYVVIQALKETARNNELSIENELNSQKVRLNKQKDDLGLLKELIKSNKSELKLLKTNVDNKDDKILNLEKSNKELENLVKSLKEMVPKQEEKIKLLEDKLNTEEVQKSDELNALVKKSVFLIQQGKNKEALDLLFESVRVEKVKFKNEITVLISRLERNEQANRQGIVGNEEYNLEINRIIHSLLNLIEELKRVDIK